MTTPAPQPILTKVETTERPPLTVAGVLAVWLQNAGGGIGAAILAVLVARALGAESDAVRSAALYAGGGTFAAFMVLRAVIDEVMDGDAYLSMLAEMRALEGERDEALADARAQRRRVRELEHELAVTGMQPRRSNFVAASAAPQDPVGRDARTMVEVYFEAGDPAARSASREAMAARGWSRKRYEAAYDELVAAGVIVPRGRRPQWVPDAETAFALLAQRTATRLDADGAGAGHGG